MSEKLNPDDNFPSMSLMSTTGDTLSVPQAGSNYQIVLFFRGKF